MVLKAHSPPNSFTNMGPICRLLWRRGDRIGRFVAEYQVVAAVYIATWCEDHTPYSTEVLCHHVRLLYARLEPTTAASFDVRSEEPGPASDSMVPELEGETTGGQLELPRVSGDPGRGWCRIPTTTLAKLQEMPPHELSSRAPLSTRSRRSAITQESANTDPRIRRIGGDVSWCIYGSIGF